MMTPEEAKKYIKEFVPNDEIINSVESQIKRVMKELSIEEKAKAYDEAIERARTIVENKDASSVWKNWLRNTFPELKEPEDEKIRKEIKQLIQCMHDADPRKERWITWLEKQGEQKPCDKVEPKFKAGDWVTNGLCSFKISSIDDKYYWGNEDTIGEDIESINNQYHLWTIQDAKEGDVLVDVYENIGIYQQHDDFDWTSYCSLGFHGGFQNFKVEHENDKTHPAAKEQRDQLEKAMADAGWEFDFEKKELKKIEQKLTWSEEDNLMLQSIIQDYVSKYEETHFDSILKKLDWLKSLKGRIGG